MQDIMRRAAMHQTMIVSFESLYCSVAL
jgi:hypothetical protein